MKYEKRIATHRVKVQDAQELRNAKCKIRVEDARRKVQCVPVERNDMMTCKCTYKAMQT